MSDRLEVKGIIAFMLVWVGISIFGWLLAPINTLNPVLRTYGEVANRALTYTAYGLIIGLIMGMGQTLLLNHKLDFSDQWFVSTLVGYALVWPMGLAISTLIPSIVFPLQGSSFLPLSEPSTTTFSPFPTDILLGGWVVGFTQWVSLRKILTYRNTRIASLWILGTWVSFGLGIIVMLIGRSAPFNINSGMVFDAVHAIERCKIGLVSGLASGLLLLFVLHQSHIAPDAVTPV